MVAPQVPAGAAVGQAVLDDEADGGGDDPRGVVALGEGQVAHRGGEVAAAVGAAVLGGGNGEDARPAGQGVAEVVKASRGGAQPGSARAAARA
jgi:hypothetical protein